ncbi:uncharacterized protein BO88DRAFT_401511 [Aspergillus vadensis CBS 113365]|uniref:Uncharacterized protein n=1 Tax=Aspergillus vadensis (strain CBS 113365 / IMI 142717 / IBT 24658) TaxID=1448311 RepID=A0A319CF42_ASPVC|nr:hypothetical protein BO88DRAFT_401511 [Aspergillus vadensis CBS 113365]PYH73928.1 hypothetical protein BO88DRAFT_401511 [Aspergillus vadensis CBS 113365]
MILSPVTKRNNGMIDYLLPCEENPARIIKTWQRAIAVVAATIACSFSIRLEFFSYQTHPYSTTIRRNNKTALGDNLAP